MIETGQFFQKIEHQGLSDFVRFQGIGDSLNDNEAKQNINSGVVELIYWGEHAANGLLLTCDGYFITNYHCLKVAQQCVVKVDSGEQFPVTSVCGYQKDLDIALVKADIADSKRAKNYKFLSSNNRSNPLNMVLRISRRDGMIDIKGGTTKGETISLLEAGSRFMYYEGSDFLVVNVYSENGDSGSVIVDPFGCLVGILTGGPEGNLHISTCIPWLKVFRFLKECVQ